MGIERFVLGACADLACLTSRMCLGETPFERSQKFIRSTARSVRQRCSIPRGVGVLVRALGRPRVSRGQDRLLLAVASCPAIGECALLSLGDALQVTSAPLLQV